MSGGVTWNRMLRSLEHPVRRRLLAELLERNPQSDRLAIPEDVYDGQGDPVNMQIEFEHVHLPLLESFGYISWNQAENSVTKGASFEEIRPVIELFEAHRDELPDGWR